MAIATDSQGAGKFSSRPVDFFSQSYGNFGHYAISVTTGATVGLTVTDAVFSCRWTAANANFLLHRLTVTGGTTASITTACVLGLEAVVARAYTAVDSAGTASTLSSFQKMRSSMGSSLLADLRVSTTGKLTAGTRTLDTSGFGMVNVAMTTTMTSLGAASLPVDLYKWDVSGRYPVVLAQNEGLIIRTPVAGNTSGSVAYTFTMEWAEVPLSSSF